MQRLDTRKLALASMLGALSGVFEIIPGPPFDIPFPFQPPGTTISWDLTGIPMIIGLLFTGPIGAVYTCLIGCSFIFIRGNFYGGVFKLVAELVTILAFAAMRRGLVTKTVTAVASRVLVMTVVNFYLLQLFYKVPESVVINGFLLPLAALNLTQALLNIIPAYVIYSKLPVRWQFWVTTETNP